MPPAMRWVRAAAGVSAVLVAGAGAASTQRAGTAAAVGYDPILTEADLKGCSFEVVMTEDRPIPKWVEQVNAAAYWSMSAIVNNAYAERHGYGFRYVHANSSLYRRSWMCKFHPAWVKLFFLEQFLQEIQQTVDGKRCVWVLYLDSDAFVRGFDAPLPSFLAHLARKYRIRRDVAAVFAEDQTLMHPKMNKMASTPNFRPLRQWLNSGVFFLQVGKAALRFVRDWIAGGLVANKTVQEGWPLEMGVLTELLRPGSYPEALPPGMAEFEGGAAHASRVSIVEMIEMNSPLGRFVSHLWGYHRYRREVDLWDALIRTGLHHERHLKEQLSRLHRRVLPWGPTDRKGTCHLDKAKWREGREKRMVKPPCYDGYCEEAEEL